MKLESKHLASYFPYGLEFITESSYSGKISRNTMTSLNERGVNPTSGMEYFDSIKPILRPLSDLTKDENDDMFELNLQLCDILNSPSCEHFIKAIIDKKYYAVDFQLFTTLSEFLDKNHFDWRFNLIDQDLAIDINTIEL